METLNGVWWIALIGTLVTQFILIGIEVYKNHSKKRWIKEQISCKKREIWDIQKQITSIVCSGDKAMICSEYTRQLANKLKQLKSEISDLNNQLKPKDQDKTKLNVTESIKVLQETIDKFGGKK